MLICNYFNQEGARELQPRVWRDLRSEAQIRRDPDLHLVHDSQTAVSRREPSHALLLHARHDERVVREQAVSTLMAKGEA